MSLSRRRFLQLTGASLVLAGCRYYPDEGLWNPCEAGLLPAHLKNHDLVLKAWEGLDPTNVWDSHVHLVGVGDNGSGIWVNPKMRSWMHPVQHTQFKFYLNAACASEEEHGVDHGYILRLLQLIEDFPLGFKSMLIAFDYRHDENGKRVEEHSSFYVPNEYAARLAREHSNAFEWIASIHPYREDCVEALESAAVQGARAIKWLPGAMGIDPTSPKCDHFYEALKKYNIPLLCHAGSEHAVDTADTEHFNNPLLLRRPLEQGVWVIIAHCASIGKSDDIEAGPAGPKLRNIELFERLMAESSYEGLLFGDISAITQVNRDMDVIEMIYRRDDWHPRLINGSDYPLPGVMPVFSLQRYVSAGYLKAEEAKVLSDIRRYNPLMFDILLKRTLKMGEIVMSPQVFESKRVFLTSA